MPAKRDGREPSSGLPAFAAVAAVGAAEEARTIAVIIPSRNDAVLLARCLSHLAAQSRPADLIIVVDNASSDDTAAVCDAAGVRRIYWEQPGVAGASACGFDAASADILARIDADSMPDSDWLVRVEAAFTGHDRLTLVTGPGDFYGGHPVVRWLGRAIYLGGYFNVVGLLLGHPPVFGSNFAMTSDVWARIGPAVTRDAPGIHDDLEISYLLRPNMMVHFEPQLRMPVSARPFDSWATLGRRLRMAILTFAMLFRAEPPLRRRRQRRAWARAHTG